MDAITAMVPGSRHGSTTTMAANMLAISVTCQCFPGFRGFCLSSFICVCMTCITYYTYYVIHLACSRTLISLKLWKVWKPWIEAAESPALQGFAEFHSFEISTASPGNPGGGNGRLFATPAGGNSAHIDQSSQLLSIPHALVSSEWRREICA
jgi:hypothetical protein